MLETSRWIFREAFGKLLLAVQPFLSPLFYIASLLSLLSCRHFATIVASVIKTCIYVHQNWFLFIQSGIYCTGRVSGARFENKKSVDSCVGV